MASRAVHLEVSNTLETVSFHNASRRFICRRVPVRQLRSDQGTNFIGANFIGAKRGTLSHADLRDRSDCEQPPANSGNLSDPESTSPLTPNHILTMKTKPVLPPPGIFQREDLYLRKRWRRVQHLSCEFWTRWKREFLHSLQERSKWTKPRRNMQVGDVVIVQDDSKARNRWSLARVIETYPNKDDGLVRSVKVAIGDPELSSTGKRVHPPSVLERPIQKLVLLLLKEKSPGLPHGEPFNEEIQKKD